MKKILFIFCTLSLVISGCSHNSNRGASDNFDNYLKVPAHFPKPVFPKSNPYSVAKAELGRYLFYEPMLVQDESFPSCSHCMYQSAAFSNTLAYARGSNNMSQMRSNMTLANVVYRSSIFWDGRSKSIEGVAYRSLWLRDIFDADTNELVRRLADSKLYPAMFKAAFADGAITATNISLAIATFVAQLFPEIRATINILQATNRLLLQKKNAEWRCFSASAAAVRYVIPGLCLLMEKHITRE